MAKVYRRWGVDPSGGMHNLLKIIRFLDWAESASCVTRYLVVLQYQTRQ